MNPNNTGQTQRNSKGLFVKGHTNFNTGRTHFKKGMVSPRKGVQMSEETKQKLSNATKGRKLSLETRKRMSIARCGNKNPAYIDGRSSNEYHRKREVFGYNLWRFSVYTRDNFICQKCNNIDGKNSGNLIAHHIESYSANPALRTSIDNGITLCKSCHKRFHSIYGYGNNNKKQMNEFLQI